MSPVRLKQSQCIYDQPSCAGILRELLREAILAWMLPLVNRANPKAVQRFFLLCLCAPLALTSPAVAGEKDASAGLSRWAPAIAIQGGLFAQTASGTITTSEILGVQTPSIDFTPPQIYNADPYLTRSGETTIGSGERMMTPYFGVAIELMSPTIPGCDFCSQIGNPRLLVHGDVGYGFALERSVASTGSVADTMTFASPPSEFYAANTGNGNLTYSETTFLGQGANISVKTEPMTVAAGAGIAFTFKVGHRTFRLKPSFEYMREELRVSGQLRRATQAANTVLPRNMSTYVPGGPLNPGAGPNNGLIWAPNGDPGYLDGTKLGVVIPWFPDDATPTDAGFREIEFDVSSSKVYHGIGPGLELELDTGRLGGFEVSLYGGLRAYRFMGDLDLDARAQNEPDARNYTTGNPITGPYGPGSNVEMNNVNYERNCVVGDPTQCEYADFHFEKERWAYTGHLGIRFRWSPE